ncbi:MAG: hypothetical protein R8G66_30480 [Cytophagales bacterium]|nr:hypothetical protein [Cytophagales bacterium]
MRSISFYLVVFVGFISLVSCDKEEPSPDPRDRGTITEQDVRRCACCGGLFIEINEETYRIMQFSESMNVDLNVDLPIDVFIEWVPQEDACLGDEINVISIELAQ